MQSARFLVALVVGLFIAFPQAGAVENFVGRWAVDPGNCNGWQTGGEQAPLIATESSLRWANMACRIGKTYRIGDDVHIQAHCWDAGAQRDIAVTLAPRGERLTVNWDQRARKEMRRCR